MVDEGSKRSTADYAAIICIQSEINIDTWPSLGMNHIPGKRRQFVYPLLCLATMMAQLAKQFLRLREQKNRRSSVILSRRRMC